MINSGDCDVEHLTLDDFEPKDSPELRHYVIEQATLSEIGKSTAAQFSVTSSSM